MADADMSRADQEALAQYGTWHGVMPATLEAIDDVLPPALAAG